MALTKKLARKEWPKSKMNVERGIAECQTD